MRRIRDATWGRLTAQGNLRDRPTPTGGSSARRARIRAMQGTPLAADPKDLTSRITGKVGSRGSCLDRVAAADGGAQLPGSVRRRDQPCVQPGPAGVPGLVSITSCTASAVNCGLNFRRRSGMNRSSQERVTVQDHRYTDACPWMRAGAHVRANAHRRVSYLPFGRSSQQLCRRSDQIRTLRLHAHGV